MVAWSRSLALLALFLALPVQAKVFTFDHLDCRCEVPDSWIFRDGRELISASDPTHQRTFILFSSPVNSGVYLNSGFMNGFQRSFIAHGFDVISQGKATIGGVQFAKAVMKRDYIGKSLNVSVYVALANGYSYCLEAMDRTGNPDDDPELQGIINSFTFIRPPVVPSATFGGAISRILNPPGTHDTGYFVGYYFILACVALVIIGVPLAILAVVGVVIYLIVRRSQRPS